MPEPKNFSYLRDIGYSAKASVADGVLSIQRNFVMVRRDYAAREYPELHTYFGRVASGDQEVLALKGATP